MTKTPTSSELLLLDPKLYDRLHAYMRRTYGAPQYCMFCMCFGDTGAFYDWAHVNDAPWDQKFSSWIRLCRKCHRKYDGTMKIVRTIRNEKWATEGNPHIGYKHTEETKAKIAEGVRRQHAEGRGGSTKRTHCYKGHEFTDENTVIWVAKDGTVVRRCRICFNSRYGKA